MGDGTKERLSYVVGCYEDYEIMYTFSRINTVGKLF